MSDKRVKSVKKIAVIVCWIAFLVYFLYMVNILFFGHFRSFDRGYYPVNLVPFSTITTYITRFDHYNYWTWFNNLFGNVMAFMPLGFLIPILFVKMNSLIKIFLISFASSLSVESIQLLLRLGSFDVDDIILNTIGGIFGFIALQIFLTVMNGLLSMILRIKDEK